MRMIDADEFLKWVAKRFNCVPLVGSCDNDSESIKLLLSQAPTVDAVEVVRCKDCIHWDSETGWCNNHSAFDDHDMDWNIYNDDDFCSCGERRTDG